MVIFHSYVNVYQRVTNIINLMMATLPQLMAHLLPFFMCFFSISIIHFFGGLGLKHLQHLFFNHAFWTITINHIQYYYIQSRHRVHTQWELMYAFIRTYKTFFQYKVYHIVYQTIQVLRRAHHFLLQQHSHILTFKDSCIKYILKDCLGHQ